MADQKPTEPNVRFDRVMEHEYDGIREYDNPMPRWWLLTFAGTVIFSIIYYFNVGPIGNGKGRIADYEDDVKAFNAAHPAAVALMTPEQLAALIPNHEAMEEGKETFTKNCAVCHAADGGGMIGPNLTDAYWIHGATLADIYKTVTNGVLEKGMQPWGKVLKPKELAEVAAYVSTLRGTKPATPKAPQGVLVQP